MDVSTPGFCSHDRLVRSSLGTVATWTQPSTFWVVRVPEESVEAPGEGEF